MPDGAGQGGRIAVGVLFGGPSAEHDVSAASALGVVRGLDRDRYRPVVIGITRDGRWTLVSDSDVEAAAARTVHGSSLDDRLTAEGTEVELRRGGALAEVDAPGTVADRLDVVLPVMHGPYGEDGVIQGYLETLGVPYTGCGVLASAVGMDKVAMRRAFTAEGIPSVPYVWFTRRQWRTAGDAAELTGDLGWPRFVKPASMGSSIGISKVDTADELPAAVEEALRYDDVVLVEHGVVDVRELMCGVLGDADEAETSAVSETRKHTDGFSDFALKYLNPDDVVMTPTVLDPELAEQVHDLSLRAFHAIGGSGLARVDFLYDEAAGRLFVGEINTMPGFTAHSVYARGFGASGTPYATILTRLIELALARRNRTSEEFVR